MSCSIPRRRATRFRSMSLPAVRKRPGSRLLDGIFRHAPGARIDSALFVATAFSITALPILGRILIELDLTRTKIGVIAISSAAANDVFGWLLLAFSTALTVSNFDPRKLALKVLMVAAFALISTKWVRPLLKGAVRRSNPRGGKMSANLLGGLICIRACALRSGVWRWPIGAGAWQ